ncbi:MAG: DUF4358 domain-containing protein [Clostridia bacterium]|jgi:hypothetical protein|nr:DUF4358 domain-containing protein [Clostridia bacterium]
MKRILISIIAIALTVSVLGCGKKKEIINSELASVLVNNAVFSEVLTEIDSSSAERRYLISPKDYSEITAYVGTNGVCDEFLIVKTSNTASMIEKLNKYLENKRSEYEKYRPGEVGKLTAPVIAEYKDTVVMIITQDTQKATSIYEEYLKK